MNIWVAGRLLADSKAEDKLKEFDLWHDFIKEERDKAPIELQSMF